MNITCGRLVFPLLVVSVAVDACASDGSGGCFGGGCSSG